MFLIISAVQDLCLTRVSYTLAGIGAYYIAKKAYNARYETKLNELKDRHGLTEEALFGIGTLEKEEKTSSSFLQMGTIQLDPNQTYEDRLASFERQLEARKPTSEQR